MQEFPDLKNIQFVLKVATKSIKNRQKIWLESENPWFRIGIWLALDVFANIYI
jgi:hypothetical protein